MGRFDYHTIRDVPSDDLTQEEIDIVVRCVEGHRPPQPYLAARMLRAIARLQRELEAAQPSA